MAWKPDPHNLKHNRHANCHRRTTLSQTYHTVTDAPHCHRRTTLSQMHHTVTDVPHCHRRTTLSQTHHTVTDAPHCHRRTTLSQTYHTVTDAPHCHRRTTLSQTHHTVTDVPHCHRRTTLSQTHHTVTDAPHCHRRTTLSLSHSLPVYLLTVSAGVATGIPAFREAWRARYAASADVCEGRARGAHTVAQPGLRPRSCGLAHTATSRQGFLQHVVTRVADLLGTLSCRVRLG